MYLSVLFRSASALYRRRLFYGASNSILYPYYCGYRDKRRWWDMKWFRRLESGQLLLSFYRNNYASTEHAFIFRLKGIFAFVFQLALIGAMITADFCYNARWIDRPPCRADFLPMFPSSKLAMPCRTSIVAPESRESSRCAITGRNSTFRTAAHTTHTTHTQNIRWKKRNKFFYRNNITDPSLISKQFHQRRPQNSKIDTLRRFASQQCVCVCVVGGDEWLPCTSTCAKHPKAARDERRIAHKISRRRTDEPNAVAAAVRNRTRRVRLHTAHMYCIWVQWHIQ